MPSTQRALDQSVPAQEEALARRRGYDPACLKHIATAEQHVKALFLGKDGATPIPELQHDQSLMLRCLNRASAHAQLVWAAAKAVDTAYTYRCCQKWWQAVNRALEQAIQSEEKDPHAH